MPPEGEGLDPSRNIPKPGSSSRQSLSQPLVREAGSGSLTQSPCPTRRAVSTPAAVSHSRIALSERLAASRPSGSEQNARIRPCPLEERRLRPSRQGSQTPIVPSSEPEANSPPRKKAKNGDLICVLRLGVPTLAPDAVSHSRIVLSARARCEPPVRQRAQSGDTIGVPLEASDLGAAGEVP